MRYVAPSAQVRESFHQGNNMQAYEMLGAHPVEQDGTSMWHFCVWAPNAKNVCLVGEFNEWKVLANPMVKQYDGTWELRLPAKLFDVSSDPKKYNYPDAAEKLKNYKYAVQTAEGEWFERADPYSFQMQQRPHNASCLYSMDGYEWHDDAWMDQRRNWNSYDKPVNIYELHLGSWRRIGSTKDGLGNTGENEATGEEIIVTLAPQLMENGEVQTRVQIDQLCGDEANEERKAFYRTSVEDVVVNNTPGAQIKLECRKETRNTQNYKSLIRHLFF